MERGVVGVINANDSVNTYELSRLPISADNDRLALFVARLVNADTLIFLTQKPGVLDEEGRVIPEIKTLCDLQKVSITDKSAHGTGGIESKIETAMDFTSSGLAVIARGGERLVLTRILAGESVGTRFYPL
jgi:glutamate 5-kinase